MLNLAPTHIKDYCFSDESDNVYNSIFNEFNAQHTAIHKIKCSCGNLRFNAYKDPNPTVKLICPKCENIITVYDLIYYPAAVKCYHSDDRFELFTENDNNEFEVYAVYEYSDPNFPEEFDGENDINWCYIFLNYEDRLIKLIDDETA